jgi:methylmalonyl-CoA mutase cobalamin-binding subunit
VFVESVRANKNDFIYRVGLCESCLDRHDIDTDLLDRSLEKLGFVED